MKALSDEIPPARDSVIAGRLCIVAAAVMWSSSGLFAKATVFHDWPSESRGMILAFWRALFAGLLLAPAIRQPRWNVRLVPMTVCFALMNATYLSAMVLTTAANAIWLQCTAPLWIFLAGLVLKTEAFQRRNLFPLLCGLLGVALILTYEAQGQQQVGIAFGLASGVCYAGVVMSMRSLRGENAAWLIALNHLVAAAALLPYAVLQGIWPSPLQLVVLAAFGLLQMGLPYLLFARGLSTVSSQEATLIGLLEPVLVPVWVFWAWQEAPDWWTLAGGGLILVGLLVRYWPRAGHGPEIRNPKHEIRNKSE
jgi:drug/metabolite transporter, DME family